MLKIRYKIMKNGMLLRNYVSDHWANIQACAHKMATPLSLINKC